MVPITRTLFADAETPVGVYRKLGAGRSGTFLLESAEPGASFSRWSFVGVRAAACLGGRRRRGGVDRARSRPASPPAATRSPRSGPPGGR